MRYSPWAYSCSTGWWLYSASSSCSGTTFKLFADATEEAREVELRLDFGCPALLLDDELEDPDEESLEVEENGNK